MEEIKTVKPLSLRDVQRMRKYRRFSLSNDKGSPHTCFNYFSSSASNNKVEHRHAAFDHKVSNKDFDKKVDRWIRKHGYRALFEDILQAEKDPNFVVPRRDKKKKNASTKNNQAQKDLSQPSQSSDGSQLQSDSMEAGGDQESNQTGNSQGSSNEAASGTLQGKRLRRSARIREQRKLNPTTESRNEPIETPPTEDVEETIQKLLKSISQEKNTQSEDLSSEQSASNEVKDSSPEKKASMSPDSANGGQPDTAPQGAGQLDSCGDAEPRGSEQLGTSGGMTSTGKSNLSDASASPIDTSNGIDSEGSPPVMDLQTTGQSLSQGTVPTTGSSVKAKPPGKTDNASAVKAKPAAISQATTNKGKMAPPSESSPTASAGDSQPTESLEDRSDYEEISDCESISKKNVAQAEEKMDLGELLFKQGNGFGEEDSSLASEDPAGSGSPLTTQQNSSGKPGSKQKGSKGKSDTSPITKSKSDPGMAPVSLEAASHHGGYFLDLDKAKELSAVERRTAKQIYNALKKLLKKRPAVFGDKSPRWNAKKVIIELIRKSGNLQKCKKEEMEHELILLMSDASGSCASMCNDTMAACLAIAEQDERILIVVHSNGQPACLYGKQARKYAPNFKKLVNLDYGEVAGGWEKLVKEIPQISICVAFGDNDAENSYQVICENGIKLYWLHPHHDYDASDTDRSNQAVKNATSNFTSRIAKWKQLPKGYYTGVLNGPTAMIALRMALAIKGNK